MHTGTQHAITVDRASTLHQLIRETSIYVLLPLMFVIMLAATELGRVSGRRYQGKKDKDATALATGMLGIFALLIAFTYSLALSRYDARKTLVVNEANAITTAAGYAQMLPREFALPSVPLLHRYSILRRDLVAPYEPDLFATQIGQSAAIRGKLWSLA